ncbi:hypothetical protein OM076_14695 [Solirubrobacter ginsenosidimutans]|uniref:Agd3 CBM87 domain-containing protein n=1 Tax=Solirubrobacter ginsenosidimutans TaxID=490573 RepID=A0A9X3S1V4_9ACTN|nr:hypothetical protein [Solirubrobacter ginsenosidimutans]MDA0161522.1 hypothetical protein [Solirubrobacter ginsenosidimutans]
MRQWPRTERLRNMGVAVIAIVALAVPVALAAPPVQVAPGQTVDLKVLLISADGSEPGFGAWKAELDREGVPYDTLQAYTGQTKTATLTDARLADYGADHARYQAVILASGDLGHNVTNPGGTISYLSAFTDAEWAMLAKFERTFGIRRLSDYTAPGPAHGLNTVGGTSQDGVMANLTPAGKAAFPYLKGPVQIANDDPMVPETFGYPATPVNTADWQTLLSGPTNNTAFLGIYTHPDDGREEMVMTVASNQFQSHNQLLRHGMLNWVTRGVFLGYQRNYLEVQVDDLFLGDDAWDPATHTTNYDPGAAIRMTPADVDQAMAWSQAHGLRLDFAFNGGGSELYKEQFSTNTDPLAVKFAQPSVNSAFGFINHTYEHPNLDCSSTRYIARQVTTNLTWARSHGIPVTSEAELVTGEHSGLANTRPGNPGTIDPPAFGEVTPAAGGLIGAGVYDYALTAKSSAGETTASITPNVTVAANGKVTATFNAVCHAIAYTLYRSPAGTNAWAVVASSTRGATDPTDDGQNPIELSLTDSVAAGTAGTPPTSNGAALAPYAQNPNFATAMTAAGILFDASDASKDYPSDPTVLTSPPIPAGGTFFEGAVQAVPRYPSNVYYNVSKQAQQLDEYNWIYTKPAGGGNCTDIPLVTTCRDTKATWAQYVASENSVMFRHVVGNDPRPHYIHQSNLAGYTLGLPETDPAQGGIAYPVFGGLLARYEAAFDRTSTKLVQLSHSEIGKTLAQQGAWAATRAAGTVTASLVDGKVHVKNTGVAPADVPLTGTTQGELYGGQTSGWITLAPGAEQVLAPSDPANTAAPSVTGTARAGETLTATKGTWAGTATIAYDYRWQRCDDKGAKCKTIATGPSYKLDAADAGSTVRVVVLAGNWISSVSQAASAVTGVVKDAPKAETHVEAGPNPQAGGGGSGNGSDSKPAARTTKLTLSKLKMAPRRFPVAHKTPPRGTRLDGSRVTFKVSTSASVRLVVQRRTTGRHKRWVAAGTITRTVKAGNVEVRFTGRFGKRLLKPSSYRLVVTAHRSGQARTKAKTVSFRVVKG